MGDGVANVALVVDYEHLVPVSVGLVLFRHHHADPRSGRGLKLLALHVPALELVGVELAHVGAISVQYKAPVVGLVAQFQARHTDSLSAPARLRLQDHHCGRECLRASTILGLVHGRPPSGVRTGHA
jgi:hypothetical protein